MVFLYAGGTTAHIRIIIFNITADPFSLTEKKRNRGISAVMRDVDTESPAKRAIPDSSSFFERTRAVTVEKREREKLSSSQES